MDDLRSIVPNENFISNSPKKVEETQIDFGFLADLALKTVYADANRLNRWIIPLERGTDYLTLHTGKKIQVPFEQQLIFATNLDLKGLVVLGTSLN